MRMFALALVSAVTLSGTAPALADLRSATPAFRTGKWVVLRDKDPMTDAVSCTGILAGEYAHQLSERALYLGIRGGLESVTLRFDDEPAKQMRLPTSTEKKSGNIILEGPEFDQAINSQRLRVQALTLVSGLKTLDLNLQGIAQAAKSIQEGCPGNAATKNVSIENPGESATAPPPAQACSPEIIQRMKTANVSAKQIGKICLL